MKIYTFNEHCLDTFGQKLYKLSLDGGFSCPNRQSREKGGCAFCAGGSGFFNPSGTIEEQLEAAKAQVREKFKGNRYIAYFQSYTNTYAPLQTLRDLFFPLIQKEEIAALSIGTRPDCLPPETVALLGELSERKPLYIELGLQTIHDSTAEAFGRGYPSSCFYEAVKQLRACPNIHIVAHLMIGLPGEGKKELLETVRAVNEAGVHGVKLHLLHILEGTPYADLFRAGKIQPLSLEEYADLLIAALKELNEGTVIHRFTGDGPKALLLAPLWSADKKRVLNYLNQKVKETP